MGSQILRSSSVLFWCVSKVEGRDGFQKESRYESLSEFLGCSNDGYVNQNKWRATRKETDEVFEHRFQYYICCISAVNHKIMRC